MQNLIYDRTNEDVENKREKAYYNYGDLNRIENACVEISTLLNQYNYPVTISTKTNWNVSNYPNSSEMERIRGNVNKLKQAFYSFTSIPSNLNKMTIDKANAIEKILYELYTLIGGMRNYFVYCGVANCGQNRMWQNRFRRIELSTPIIMNWSRLSSYETWNDLAEDFEKWGDVIV